jgi:hypothetical protein
LGLPPRARTREEHENEPKSGGITIPPMEIRKEDFSLYIFYIKHWFSFQNFFPKPTGKNLALLKFESLIVEA